MTRNKRNYGNDKTGCGTQKQRVVETRPTMLNEAEELPNLESEVEIKRPWLPEHLTESL
jgi:hypothetical protein